MTFPSKQRTSVFAYWNVAVAFGAAIVRILISILTAFWIQKMILDLAEKSQHSTCCTLSKNKFASSQWKPRQFCREATESEEDTVWAAYKMLFYREALELNEKQLFLFRFKSNRDGLELHDSCSDFFGIARIVGGNSLPSQWVFAMNRAMRIDHKPPDLMDHVVHHRATHKSTLQFKFCFLFHFHLHWVICSVQAWLQQQARQPISTSLNLYNWRTNILWHFT